MTPFEREQKRKQQFKKDRRKRPKSAAQIAEDNKRRASVLMGNVQTSGVLEGLSGDACTLAAGRHWLGKAVASRGKHATVAPSDSEAGGDERPAGVGLAGALGAKPAGGLLAMAKAAKQAAPPEEVPAAPLSTLARCRVVTLHRPPTCAS